MPLHGDEVFFITPTPVGTAVFTGIAISAVSTGLTTFAPNRASAIISTFTRLGRFARLRRLTTFSTPSRVLSNFLFPRLCSFSTIFSIVEFRWNHCSRVPGVHFGCDHIVQRRKSIRILQIGTLFYNNRGSDYDVIVLGL